METVHAIFAAFTDASIAATSGLGPGTALVVVSLVVGLVMLVIFRYASDHDEIEQAKHRMQAHLMEMRLFDREPGVVMKAAGRLFAWNGRYFLRSLKPAAVLMPPTIFLLIQFDHAWGMRPVEPGETAVVTARLSGDENFETLARRVTIAVEGGAEVQTDPVRSLTDREIAWRVLGVDDGTAVLSLTLDDETVTKTFDVGQPGRRISWHRGSSRSDRLLTPIEPPLSDSAFEWIEVRYPAFEPPVLGQSIHWLVTLFVVSVFGALGIRAIVNAARPGLL